MIILQHSFRSWLGADQTTSQFMNQWSLQWRHNGSGGVSKHRPHDGLFKRLFKAQIKENICVTGLCVGNPPVTGEFPAQRASKAENVSIWWRHYRATLLTHTPFSLQELTRRLARTLAAWWVALTLVRCWYPPYNTEALRQTEWNCELTQHF